MTIIKSDRIVTPDGIADGFTVTENGKITGIVSRCDAADITDLTGSIVAPGIIDLHTHGGGGYPFINNTAADVINACDFHLSHGTTSIMPTVTAGTFSVMKKAVQNIAEAAVSGKTAANIIGAHMEGPYLSAAQCGAQCPDFITPPLPDDYVSLVKEYGKFIRRWTYAPENDAEGDFCRFLSENGIIPTAGHTDASIHDMEKAISWGCRGITHIYSCTSTVRRDHGFRIPGVIESAFLFDGLFAEMITDGKHLPPEMIKMIVKIKGISDVTACTDSLAIAGTGTKEGVMSGTPFIVEDGVCRLRDRSAFAGSIASGDTLLGVLTKECGFSLPEAFTMLSDTPARICGLGKGRISAGYDADIIVLSPDMRVEKVMVNGRFII